YHYALNLARALVDLGDLRVAVVALGRILAHVAVPTEDLHGVLRYLVGDLRGHQLAHRRLGRVPLAGRLEPRGPVGQQPGRVDLGRHVGEHEADRLMVGDRLAKGLALGRVAGRRLKRPAGDAQRLRGDADPTAVEGAHRDLEPVADLTEQLI